MTGRIAALSLLWKLPNAGLWILSVFRSGVAFERGHGKVFYFRPGHETYPIYFDKNVLKVIGNAVRWAKPLIFQEHNAPNAQPLEKIRTINPHSVGAGIVRDLSGKAK